MFPLKDQYAGLYLLFCRSNGQLFAETAGFGQGRVQKKGIFRGTHMTPNLQKFE